MFTQVKRDRPKEPRFLPDCRLWNTVRIRNNRPLSNIEEAIEFIAARPWWGMIDLTDAGHKIPIDSKSEDKTTCLCYMVHNGSQVMQQGDFNAPPPLVRSMNVIFEYMMCKDLIIYVDNITILSATNTEHVEALPRGLQCLQDQQVCL